MTLGDLAKDFFERSMLRSPFEATESGVDGYDHLVPDLSAAAERRQRAEFEALAAAVAEVDADGLGPADRVTRAMLLDGCRSQAADLAAGWPEFTVAAATGGVHLPVLSTVPRATLTTPQHATAYLRRCEQLGTFLDQAVERLREGLAGGRTPTAHGVRATIAQLDAYLASPIAEDPIASRPAPDGVDGDRWRADLTRIVEGSVRPALRRYRDDLERDALPQARPDDRAGIAHVPGGERAYRDALRMHTTTELSPDEIHALGLELVDGLRAEYERLGRAVFGTGDVDEVIRRLRDDTSLRFSDGAQILAAARDALDRAVAAVPAWFGRLPRAACDVAEMPAFEAKDAVLGYYQLPAADGSRPGYHWVNTYEPHTRARFEYEALSFHESVPGHHLQLALQQELGDLPSFRRFGYLAAFSEGWALYTERLADEMGLYTGDLDRLGMVSFDSWRACRLVVDTGMHHLGWGRRRAIDYMLANSALTPVNISNEVDRYIAWPGQACAYMVGRREIERLRSVAATALGGAFDLPAFHDAVLRNGGVPMRVLADEIDAWLRGAA